MNGGSYLARRARQARAAVFYKSDVTSWDKRNRRLYGRRENWPDVYDTASARKILALDSKEDIQRQRASIIVTSSDGAIDYF